MLHDPVFSHVESERLQDHVPIQQYLSITKAHVVGLLAALGEYAGRIGPPDLFVGHLPGSTAADTRTVQAHRDLISFCALWKRPEADGPVSEGESVFDVDERRSVGRHKYVRDGANLTKHQLIGLLEALVRYREGAPQMEQLFCPLQGVVRLIHAHNALIAFCDRPFTDEEFAMSMRAVLRGEESQLTARCTRRPL